MIYHFINEADLEKYLNAEELRLPTIESEGFIHCSTQDQVIAVANLQAPYDEEMKLLEIDESKVRPEIRYEDSMNDGRLFPHIYGALNRDAILNVSHLDWDGEEGYSLPADLLAAE